mgnify:CR=1 FL=1
MSRSERVSKAAPPPTAGGLPSLGRLSLKDAPVGCGPVHGLDVDGEEDDWVLPYPEAVGVKDPKLKLSGGREVVLWKGEKKENNLRWDYDGVAAALRDSLFNGPWRAFYGDREGPLVSIVEGQEKWMGWSNFSMYDDAFIPQDEKGRVYHDPHYMAVDDDTGVVDARVDTARQLMEPFLKIGCDPFKFPGYTQKELLDACKPLFDYIDAIPADKKTIPEGCVQTSEGYPSLGLEFEKRIRDFLDAKDEYNAAYYVVKDNEPAPQAAVERLASAKDKMAATRQHAAKIDIDNMFKYVEPRSLIKGIQEMATASDQGTTNAWTLLGQRYTEAVALDIPRRKKLWTKNMPLPPGWLIHEQLRSPKVLSTAETREVLESKQFLGPTYDYWKLVKDLKRQGASIPADYKYRFWVSGQAKKAWFVFLGIVNAAGGHDDSTITRSKDFSDAQIEESSKRTRDRREAKQEAKQRKEAKMDTSGPGGDALDLVEDAEPGGERTVGGGRAVPAQHRGSGNTRLGHAFGTGHELGTSDLEGQAQPL